MGILKETIEMIDRYMDRHKVNDELFDLLEDVKGNIQIGIENENETIMEASELLKKKDEEIKEVYQ